MNVSDKLAQEQERLKELTILYVEDDELTRELGRELLSRFVGVVITATNGSEGIISFQQYHPDIVITDIQMPIMDGLTMVQEIRTLNKLVPVIILSASEDSDYFRRCLNLGANGYVIKPIEVSKMIESVHECARNLTPNIAS